MKPGQLVLVTVDTASPLKIRETAGATPLPARIIIGSSYTATAGDRVLASFVGGRWYILGADA